MKSQRSIFTLNAQNEDSSVQNIDDFNTVTSLSNFFYPDPNWPQLISPEPEPLIPCYFYQYPLLQLPYEQFPSVTSIYNPNMNIGSLDNFNYFTENFRELPSCVCPNVPPAIEAGYGDGYVSEVYPGDFILEDFPDLPYEVPDTYPMVTNYGAVTILLRHLVRVDISPDRALYVTIAPADCIAAMNGSSDKSCVIHPNGRVFHEGNDIHIATLNRQAKICRKGIIFTASNLCLSYLVDASGTKTTAERFRDLSQDFSLQVFYSESMVYNPIEQCYKMIEESFNKTLKNGSEMWVIGGFRIVQDQWGDVKISRSYGRRFIKVSPTNGQVTVKTYSTEICVDRYPNNYLYVRKDDQIVSASVRGFSVQCGTQRAGINSYGKVVLH